MKVVIFAGGQGTRISEESHLKPKPMIEIGGKPLLWHIMKIYEKQGFTDFVICLGYMGYYVKEYFLNYYLVNSDITVDLVTNKTKIHKTETDEFRVTLVDTGLETRTAGRLRRIKEYIGNERFMLTYGDGVADVDINKLVEFHNKHGKIATMTIVQPEGRFGSLETDKDGVVNTFKEKPQGDGNWINGGFFVLEPQVFDYLDERADNIMWEDEPLEKLVKEQQLMAYKHFGFWRCMDALRDKVILEELWLLNRAKWKIW